MVAEMSMWVMSCLRGSRVVITEVCYFYVGAVVLGAVDQEVECWRNLVDHNHQWLQKP